MLATREDPERKDPADGDIAAGGLGRGCPALDTGAGLHLPGQLAAILVDAVAVPVLAADDDLARTDLGAAVDPARGARSPATLTGVHVEGQRAALVEDRQHDDLAVRRRGARARGEPGKARLSAVEAWRVLGRVLEVVVRPQDPAGRQLAGVDVAVGAAGDDGVGGACGSGDSLRDLRVPEFAARRGVEREQAAIATDEDRVELRPRRQREPESATEGLLAGADPAGPAGGGVERVDVTGAVESEHGAIANDDDLELAAFGRLGPRDDGLGRQRSARVVVLAGDFAAEQARAQDEGGEASVVERASRSRWAHAANDTRCRRRPMRWRRTWSAIPTASPAVDPIVNRVSCASRPAGSSCCPASTASRTAATSAAAGDGRVENFF
jgi:hypothetical protein